MTTTNKLDRLKKLVDTVQNADMAAAEKGKAFIDIGSLAVKERFAEADLDELRRYIEGGKV